MPIPFKNFTYDPETNSFTGFDPYLIFSHPTPEVTVVELALPSYRLPVMDLDARRPTFHELLCILDDDLTVLLKHQAQINKTLQLLSDHTQFFELASGRWGDDV